MFDPVFAAIVVFVGAFVQTSIGFGLAIVSAPLLFLIDPRLVPVPITFATLANVVFGSWHYRRHLSLRGLLPAAITRIPGSVLGAWLLIIASTQTLAIFIAVLIVVGMSVNFMRFQIPLNTTSLSVAGFLSGLMGTATSIGGPPMAIVMQGQQANAIRGNLAAYFLYSSLISLIILTPAGYVGWVEIRLALPLIPASLLGSWFASKMSHRINERWMTYGTIGLCGFSVVMMLLQYFG